MDPEKWNDLAERTIRAIRLLNPQRLLIVGSTCWNSPDTLKQLKVFEDDRIIYTFHCYAPFEFTHQRGVLQVDPIYYNRTMTYPGDIERYRDYHRVVHGQEASYVGLEQMDIRFLRQALQGAFEFVKLHPDKILWCGEFGTIRHAPPRSRENWMRDMIRLFKEHHIPYSVWNYLSTPNDGNRFSLVDDDERKILTPELLRIIQGDV